MEPQLLALRTSSRQYSKAEPWKLFVPDLVIDGDNAAGHFSVLNSVVIRLDAIFLNGIRAGKDVSRVSQAGHIDAAIEVVAHRADSTIDAAVDEGSLLRITEGDHRVGLSRIERGVLHAGRQFEELIGIAIHQREIHELLIFDGAAQLGAGGIHKRRPFRNRNGRADRLDFQDNIQFSGDVERQLDPVAQKLLES